MITEEVFRSIEAALLSEDGDPGEIVSRGSVATLPGIVYGMLRGDPKWDAARTIEKLRRVTREVFGAQSRGRYENDSV